MPNTDKADTSLQSDGAAVASAWRSLQVVLAASALRSLDEVVGQLSDSQMAASAIYSTDEVVAASAQCSQAEEV